MNIKKILLTIMIVCLCLIPGVRAAADDVTISSVKSVSISDGVVSNSSDSIDVEFNDLGQNAIYEVTLKNNTKKNLYVNDLEVEDVSKSFVKYVLDSKSIGKVLKANSNETFTILLSTQNEEGAGVNFSDEINFKLLLNEKIDNPNTTRNNIISMILLIILGAATITFITLQLNSKKESLIITVVCFMLLGISLTYADDTITVNLNGNVTYTSQNLLETSGIVISNAKADYTNSKDVWVYNDKVKNIIISHELYENENATKLDLTIDDKNRVSGYLVPNASDSNYYDLYIAANGVIYAPEDSTGLFSFPNVETITGLENIIFTGTKLMTGMFIGDESLKSVNLSTVRNMRYVKNASYMFYKCYSLDLSDVKFVLDKGIAATNMFVKYLYDEVKNNAISDITTDFAKEPVTGKYIVNSTVNDKYPIYYYRGATENNNVIFASLCWQIVRTTETGGIKLIYNGFPAEDGSCNNTGENSIAALMPFNESINSPAYVGYMHGPIYTIETKRAENQSESFLYGKKVVWDGEHYVLSDTISSTLSDAPEVIKEYPYSCLNTTGICARVNYMVKYIGYTEYYFTLSDGKNMEDAIREMFTNTNDSTIKALIDEWYRYFMISYTEKLEDTVWCNDRTILNSYLKQEREIRFGAYERGINSAPSLNCQQKNDMFTVSSDNGNGALTYPVGLLTVDETLYAGVSTTVIPNVQSFLGNSSFWTNSPFRYVVFTNADDARNFFVINLGVAIEDEVNDEYGVRPSVSLKPGIDYFRGIGTVNDPYIIVE